MALTDWPDFYEQRANREKIGAEARAKPENPDISDTLKKGGAAGVVPARLTPPYLQSWRAYGDRPCGLITLHRG